MWRSLWCWTWTWHIENLTAAYLSIIYVWSEALDVEISLVLDLAPDTNTIRDKTSSSRATRQDFWTHLNKKFKYKTTEFRSYILQVNGR